MTLKLIVFALAASIGMAQTQFEAASAKLNIDGGDKSYVQALPGRLVMRNFSLRGLILFAYGVRDFQIAGDSSLLGSSDHYDIQATAAGNASVQQMEGPMLRTLLEDRLQLKIHRETRQLPVYELTVAKGGVKLQRTKDGSCTPYSMDATPPVALAPGEPHPIFCGFPHLGVDGLNRTLDGAGVSIAVLSGTLARSGLERAVIDRTGLEGLFDIHLKWTMDATVNSTEPSLFTALREQLGLKLESAKGPVEVLIVDHVEKPSGN